MTSIILASQSPRRKQLLEWADLAFQVYVKETEESFPPGTSPTEAAIMVARQKAAAVAGEFPPEQLILAADTMVVLGDRIIGKPKSREEAMEILSALSGTQHVVVTGVVLRRGTEEWSFSDSTRVHFHPLSSDDIRYYVDRYQPFDKAGAYAIQEWIGVVGIRSVEGDFYNVMGLPVSRVVQLLREVNSSDPVVK